MKLLGVIPARAGSQRLPNKNLASLGGRPLIAHTCRAAREAAVCTSLYVNTDCPRIAAAAASWDIGCPALRPAHLATSAAPTRDAVLWLLNLLEERGERFDALLILQPTSPLRSAQDIRAAWELYRRCAPRPVVSVSPIAPLGWLGRVAPDGGFERMSGDDVLHRINGAIYLHECAEYRRAGALAGARALVMPAERGIDIDTPADLRLAEALLTGAPHAGHDPDHPRRAEPCSGFMSVPDGYCRRTTEPPEPRPKEPTA